MSKSTNPLVRQFWSHVFNTPDKIAVLVKNDAPEHDLIFVSAGYPGMGSAYIPERPTHRGVSWKECGLIVSEIMSFLQKHGFDKNERSAILAWNRPEWVWVDLAIQSLQGTSVPIYPNSATDQVSYILRDSGAKTIFIDGADQAAKTGGQQGVVTFAFSDVVKNAVDFTGAVSRQPTAAALAIYSAIETEFKRSATAGSFLGISGDDIATIIYTSGSTGVPKGVVLTHHNIASACQALGRHGFTFKPNDVYLSYLPLAHVYERVNGTSLCLWFGVTSAFCKVEEMADVVKQIRPTVLLGVPAVWRKIKDKAEAQLHAATGLKKMIVGWAMKQTKPGLKRKIADLLVFSKNRAALGGRVRIMLSGGAPIAADVVNFFDLTGFTLRQGYGLTETTGGIATNTIDNNRPGSVGQVVDCVDVRIVPEPGDTSGSGVIWLKGDCVTPGYWHLPEANASSFDAEGWFNTGDLGRFDKDKYLFITGRKKRLLKTDGGKYVAPEKLENAFDGIDELVQYVVPVGDGKPFIGALIFVNQDKARKLLGDKAAAIPTDAAAFFASHPAIVKRVQEIVDQANKSLERWETIKQFNIVPMAASVDNGLLTNKLSIRTEEVLKRYGTLVDELFTRRKGKE
ncbi:MAG: long-chain fatty acid--CoA ligase [Candidatus Melainabacteria bacterium]|nr:long-chain fatty acid--CoA ligase [Candidatus Melainabacteria bacterium]